MGRDIGTGKTRAVVFRNIDRVRFKQYLFIIIVLIFLLCSDYLSAQEIDKGQQLGFKAAPAQNETADSALNEAVKEKIEFQIAPEPKGYTYNLKRLLEEVEVNLKKIDEDIESAKIRDRNKKREDEVREYFEKGNALYAEGELCEAKEQWLKALKISNDPEMKDYIRSSEQRAVEEDRKRKQEEAEKQQRLKKLAEEREQKLNHQAKVFYDQAISFYRAKSYEQALVKFEEATKIVESYSNSDYYLKLIPEYIQREKDLAEKQRQRKLEQEKQAKIDTLYKEAVSLYNDDELDKAKTTLNEILSLEPDNRRVKNYLDVKIPARVKRIEDARKEAELKRQKELKAQQREKQLLEEKRQQELKRQQEEAARLETKKQEELKKQQEATEKQRQRKLEQEKQAKIDTLYKEAVSLYNDDELDKAKTTLNEILSLEPDNRRVKNYLDVKIPARVKRIEDARKEAELKRQKELKAQQGEKTAQACMRKEK